MWVLAGRLPTAPQILWNPRSSSEPCSPGGLRAISGPLREPAFHGDTRWGMAVCSRFSSSENWCPS